MASNIRWKQEDDDEEVVVVVSFFLVVVVGVRVGTFIGDLWRVSRVIARPLCISAEWGKGLLYRLWDDGAEECGRYPIKREFPQQRP